MYQNFLNNSHNVYIRKVFIFILEIHLIKLKNNVYGIIEPSSDYIALKARLYYINLSAKQLSKCKETTDFIICYHVQPIYNVKGSCDTMLFRNSNNPSGNCNFRYIKFTQNVWHKLDNKNTWYKNT